MSEARQSSFDAPRHHTLDVVALEEKEDEHHWNDREHRAGHHQLRVPDVFAREIGKRDRRACRST